MATEFVKYNIYTTNMVALKKKYYIMLVQNII